MLNQKTIKKLAESNEIEGANCSVYLFEDKKTKENPINAYSMNVNDKVVEEIRPLVQKYLEKNLKIIDENGLKEIPLYNPGNDQGIFQLDAKKVGNFTELYKMLSNLKPSLPYNKAQIKNDKIKAWVFCFDIDDGDNTEQLMVFQKFQPSKMLAQKGITLFEENGIFQLMDKNILNINLEMDFIYYKNTFIVTKMPAFEAVFSYQEFYKKDAKEFINALETEKILKQGTGWDIKFEKIDDVEKKIEQSTRVAHKFHSAKANQYYNKIDFRKLYQFNKKKNLNLNLDTSKQQWFVDEQTDLFTVARVLNDDYEKSITTDIEYVVEGKEII